MRITEMTWQHSRDRKRARYIGYERYDVVIYYRTKHEDCPINCVGFITSSLMNNAVATINPLSMSSTELRVDQASNHRLN